MKILIRACLQMNHQQKIHYDSSYDIKNDINKNILIINNILSSSKLNLLPFINKTSSYFAVHINKTYTK